MPNGKILDTFVSRIIRAGTKMILGSDETGDMYYRGSDGLLKRLPIGLDEQFLSIASGLPVWSPPPSSGVSYNIVTKSANETLASGSTTLQDDDHLQFAVTANSVYEGMLGLRLKKNTPDAATNGLRLLLLLPSIQLYNGVNWSINKSVLYVDATNGLEATVGISDTSDTGRCGEITGQSATWAENSNGYLNHNVQIPFQFRTGGTGGTAKLQWCIRTGYAANWTLLQGSFLKYYKVM